MIKALSLLSLTLTTTLLCQTAAQAWPMRFTAQDGSGDEISVKKGWLGKEKVVKDRLGDGYVQKKGLFGTKETQVNLLGNTYATKKGLFGNKEVQVKSILGDSFTTKKHWYGRTTSVNASGIGSLLDSTLKGKLGKLKSNPLVGSSQTQAGPPASGDPLNQPMDFQPSAVSQPSQLASPSAFSSSPQRVTPMAPVQQSIGSDPINSNNDVLQFGPTH